MKDHKPFHFTSHPFWSERDKRQRTWIYTKTIFGNSNETKKTQTVTAKILIRKYIKKRVIYVQKWSLTNWPSAVQPLRQRTKWPQTLCFSAKPETMKTTGAQTFHLEPALPPSLLSPPEKNHPSPSGKYSRIPVPHPGYDIKWYQTVKYLAHAHKAPGSSFSWPLWKINLVIDQTLISKHFQ